MNERSARHRRLLAMWTVLLVLAGAGFGACSTTGVPAGDAGAAPGAPALPTPMATSVQTSDGTWATIPMGRLDDPLNTFWQLLFRPAGGASWSNQVEATATATNGGLVLASPGDRSLVVGIRPSVGLTFTPLLSTSDAARSWSEGLITAGLAARPAALATDTGGQALALVGAGDDAEVVTNVGGISSWRTLAAAAGTSRTKSQSMPGYWEPWPENSIATRGRCGAGSR